MTVSIGKMLKDGGHLNIRQGPEEKVQANGQKEEGLYGGLDVLVQGLGSVQQI